MVAVNEEPVRRLGPAAKVQSTIRFDPDVYDQVARAAEADGLPVNTWLVQVVTKELDRRARGRVAEKMGGRPLGSA